MTAHATPARVARSYLFVPGGRPDRFDKALAAGAHHVIIDLEDAVAPDAKGAARQAVARWASAEHPVAVRINGATTAWFADDLELCAHPGVNAIVLPKAEHPDELAQVSSAAGRALELLPLIETARGLWNALDVARTPGVARLLLGSLDLQLDLGATDEELVLCRSQLVLVSRLAELQPPVDGVTTNFDDPAVLVADLARARRYGFGGKLCIHPRQVEPTNAAFAPSADEVAWAERVIAADALSGGAAVAVEGKMVDRPVLLRARNILAAAAQKTP